MDMAEDYQLVIVVSQCLHLLQLDQHRHFPCHSCGNHSLLSESSHLPSFQNPALSSRKNPDHFENDVTLLLQVWEQTSEQWSERMLLVCTSIAPQPHSKKWSERSLQLKTRICQIWYASSVLKAADSIIAHSLIQNVQRWPIATILHYVKHVKGVSRPWLEVPMLTSLKKPPYQEKYPRWWRNISSGNHFTWA